MTKIEEIEYLVANDKYGNEWQGAGMWEAVLTIMGNTMEFSKEDLDTLLEKAANR